jgi:hypothetical protein
VTVRAAHEVNIVRIADGVYAQVVILNLLPRHFDVLLRRLSITRRWPITVLGTRRACDEAEHDWKPWLRGFDKAPEPSLRASSRHGLVELLLNVCVFCEAVEVRDLSYDVLDPSLPTGRLDARRRNDVLGRYSGKRPGGRQYL